MLTSGDIAQQFQAQNQGFMGMRDYSQRIGMAGGGPMGLGQYGAVPPMPGVGFNYSPSAGYFSPDYGEGNRFAAGAYSGLGFMKGAADISAGYLGLAGFLPNSIAHALPFGKLATGALGMGVGAGLSGFGLAAGAAISGGQQQYAVNNAMAGYNFFNPASRTGSGFTRQDATAVGSLTRQMAELPQMMTSMEELTRIMSRLKGTGLMQGATTSTEFGGRFREAITTIRETAKILGTTMEDATNFFAHSRSVGFLGRTDQLKNALNVQFTSGMTGLTQGQVQQVQQQGADLSSRLGGRRRIGAETASSLARTIGVGIMSGRINSEDILNLTGREGPEGTAAAAAQLQEGMIGMALGTSTGTLLTAGMMKVTGNKAEIDQDLLRKFSTGQMSLDELKGRASRLSDHDKMVFMNERENLAQGLASTPGGISMFYKSLVRQHGDAGAKLLMRNQGFNSNQVDLISSMERVSQDEQFGNFEAINSAEAKLREKSPGAVWERTKTRIKAATLGRIENFFAEGFNAVAASFEAGIDDFVGRHRATATQGSAELVARVMGGGRREVENMFGRAANVKLREDRGLLSRFGVGSERNAELVKSLLGGSQDAGSLIDAGKFTNIQLGDTKGIIGRVLDADETVTGSADNSERLLAATKAITRKIGSGLGWYGPALETMTKGEADKIEDFETRELANKYIKYRNKVGPNMNPAMVMAVEAGTHGLSIGGSLTEGSRESIARKLETLQKDTTKSLEGLGLDKATASAVMSSPNIRKYLVAAHSNDENVLSLLRSHDDAAGARALKISGTDYQMLKAAYSKTSKEGVSRSDLKAAMEGIGDFEAITAKSDMLERLSAEGTNLQSGASLLRLSEDSKVQGYADELDKLSGSLSRDKLGSPEGMSDAIEQIRAFSKKVSGDKSLSSTQKMQIAGGSGMFGAGIAALETLKGKGGHKFASTKVLAEQLHLGSDGEEKLNEILGVKSGSAFTLGAKSLEKLQNSSIGDSLAGLIARPGTTVGIGGSVADKTLVALRDLQKTIAINTAVVAKYEMTPDQQRRVQSDTLKTLGLESK